jgi:hypothetical protein
LISILLNPFINSGGTRYHACLVAEDVLLEDFPEPEAKEEVDSKLLDLLRLNSRWGLSRKDIETALVERGADVLNKLKLDPEAFRLVAIPADLYTHLGPQRGWGQKEMWTHYDGYRVLEGGKLQALAGGDKRFGGTSDVVSFSPIIRATRSLSALPWCKESEWRTGRSKGARNLVEIREAAEALRSLW